MKIHWFWKMVMIFLVLRFIARDPINSIILLALAFGSVFGILVLKWAWGEVSGHAPQKQ